MSQYSEREKAELEKNYRLSLDKVKNELKSKIIGVNPMTGMPYYDGDPDTIEKKAKDDEDRINKEYEDKLHNLDQPKDSDDNDYKSPGKIEFKKVQPTNIPSSHRPRKP